MTFNDKNIEYMRVACLECDQSDCEVKTGCVVVQNGELVLKTHNVLGVGASTLPERDRALHAEAAAVAAASKTGRTLSGCDMYLTRFPCVSCAMLLTNAGIGRVYYMSDLFTSGNVALPILESADIEVAQIPETEVWSRDDPSQGPTRL